MSFITQGATVLPAIKQDARVPTGVNTEWKAADSNQIRQALLDIQQYVLSLQNQINTLPAGTLNNSAAQILATGTTTYRALGDALSDTIHVAQFGIIQGSGLSNDQLIANDTGFLALNTYGQANPGKTYLFSPGTYEYGASGNWQASIWPSGIAGTFRGNRTKLSCRYTGVYAGPCLQSGTDFFDYWGYQGTTPRSVGRINTVAQGAQTVTFQTAGWASNFSVGDWCIIFGYSQQIGGWGPNWRYHEYVQVSAVNTGANSITFYRPLRYEYRQDWSDFSGSQPYGSYPWGAARCQNLTTLTSIQPLFPNPIKVADYQTWEDFDFLISPADASDPGPYGLFSIAGFTGTVRITNCRIGLLWIGFGPRFEIRDSFVGNMEVDKMGGAALFENCHLGNVNGGGGFDSITYRDCVVDGFNMFPNVLSARSSMVDNCDLYVTTQSGSQLITMGGQFPVFRNNRIWDMNSIGTIISFNTGGTSVTVANGSSPTKTKIDVNYTPTTDTPLFNLFPGTVLIDLTTLNSATILRSYYNSGAGTATIELVAPGFQLTPIVGEVFANSPTIKMIEENNIMIPQGSFGQPLQSAFPLGYNTPAIAASKSLQTRRSATIPLPTDVGVLHDFSPGLNATSIIDRMVVHVQTAATFASGGASCWLYPSGGGGGLGIQSVNLLITGKREATPWAVNGVQSGDSWVVLPQLAGQALQHFYITNQGSPFVTAPKGYIVLDIIDTPN